MILKKLHNLLYPSIGEIWCLHRVVYERSPFRSNRNLEITPEYLRNLIIKYESEGYVFCSIDEMVRHIEKSMPFFKRKYVNVSFDDGFSDVYTNAYPILKEYGIPFTLYLATGFPDKSVNLWWLKLENMIKEHDRLVLTDGRILDCESQENKLSAFESLSNEIFKSTVDPVWFFENLFDKSYYGDDLMDLCLSWSMIDEMVSNGLCTVGSHTVSHTILTKINEESLVVELEESRRRIEEQLKIKVSHFSYPYSFLNKSVKSNVQKAGYCSAVIGFGGKVRKRCDLFELHRKEVLQDF